jgi:hypothetical protein
MILQIVSIQREKIRFGHEERIVNDKCILSRRMDDYCHTSLSSKIKSKHGTHSAVMFLVFQYSSLNGNCSTRTSEYTRASSRLGAKSPQPMKCAGFVGLRQALSGGSWRRGSRLSSPAWVSLLGHDPLV